MQNPKIIYFQTKAGENLPVDVLAPITEDAFALLSILVRMFTGFNTTQLLALAGILGKYEDPQGTFAAAFAQLKDLEKDELKEITDAAIEGFDLTDDELEAKLEALLLAISFGGREIYDAIELVSFLIAVIRNPDTSIGQKLKTLGDTIDQVVNQAGDFFDVWEQIRDAIEDLQQKANPEAADKIVEEVIA